MILDCEILRVFNLIHLVRLLCWLFDIWTIFRRTTIQLPINWLLIVLFLALIRPNVQKIGPLTVSIEAKFISNCSCGCLIKKTAYLKFSNISTGLFNTSQRLDKSLTFLVNKACKAYQNVAKKLICLISQKR